MKRSFLFLSMFCIITYLRGQADATAGNANGKAGAVPAAATAKSHQDILNDKLRSILASSKSDSLRFEILAQLAYSYAWSNPDTAILFAQEQLLLAKTLSSVQLEGRALWSNGVVASTMGNYSQAIDFFLQDLLIAEKLNDQWRLYQSNLGLCVTYRDEGNYEKSIYYAYRCKKASLNLIRSHQSGICIHIASIYEKFDHLDSALLYADAAAAMQKTVDNKRINGALAYIFGNIYSKKGNYSLALQHYREGTRVALEWNVRKDLVEIYNGLVKTFLKMGQTDSSIFYAKQAISVAKSTLYLNGVMVASNLLANIYKAQNKNDSALKYMLLTETTRDNVFDREKQNQAKYTSFKEQLRNQELAAEKLKYQTIIKIVIGSVVVFCVIIFLLIYFRNRHLIHVLRIRNRIAGDLHDEIGSTLSGLNMLSAVALTKSTENPEATSIIQQIKNSIQQAGESIDDIVWSVNPANDSAQDAFARIRKFVTELAEAKGFSSIIEIDEPGSALSLPMELRRDIYMVCKEAVNNAFKYSGGKNISVALRLKNHAMIITVKDDGQGFDTAILQESERNGIGNMRQRIEKHKGIFELLSTKGNGTSILCKVPLK